MANEKRIIEVLSNLTYKDLPTYVKKGLEKEFQDLFTQYPEAKTFMESVTISVVSAEGFRGGGHRAEYYKDRNHIDFFLPYLKYQNIKDYPDDELKYGVILSYFGNDVIEELVHSLQNYFSQKNITHPGIAPYPDEDNPEYNNFGDAYWKDPGEMQAHKIKKKIRKPFYTTDEDYFKDASLKLDWADIPEPYSYKEFLKAVGPNQIWQSSPKELQVHNFLHTSEYTERGVIYAPDPKLKGARWSLGKKSTIPLTESNTVVLPNEEPYFLISGTPRTASLPNGEQYESYKNTLDLSYPDAFINVVDQEHNNMSKGKEIDSESLKFDKKTPELVFEKGLHTQDQTNNNSERRLTPYGGLQLDWAVNNYSVGDIVYNNLTGEEGKIVLIGKIKDIRKFVNTQPSSFKEYFDEEALSGYFDYPERFFVIKLTTSSNYTGTPYVIWREDEIEDSLKLDWQIALENVSLNDFVDNLAAGQLWKINHSSPYVYNYFFIEKTPQVINRETSIYLPSCGFYLMFPEQLEPTRNSRGEEPLRDAVFYKNDRDVTYTLVKTISTTASKKDEPSEAQIEAGNYKKDHVRKDGLDITIENEKGSTRSGTDSTGEEWSIKMKNDYGYIKGTVGFDKDHVDCFLSNDYKEDSSVFVVNQLDDKGEFDEHKCMLGFENVKDAEKAYTDNYEDDWDSYDDIVEMPMEEFKEWVYDKKATKKPAEELQLDWAMPPAATISGESVDIKHGDLFVGVVKMYGDSDYQVIIVKANVGDRNTFIAEEDLLEHVKSYEEASKFANEYCTNNNMTRVLFNYERPLRLNWAVPQADQDLEKLESEEIQDLCHYIKDADGWEWKDGIDVKDLRKIWPEVFANYHLNIHSGRRGDFVTYQGLVSAILREHQKQSSLTLTADPLTYTDKSDMDMSKDEFDGRANFFHQDIKGEEHLWAEPDYKNIVDYQNPNNIMHFDELYKRPNLTSSLKLDWQMRELQYHDRVKYIGPDTERMLEAIRDEYKGIREYHIKDLEYQLINGFGEIISINPYGQDDMSLVKFHCPDQSHTFVIPNEELELVHDASASLKLDWDTNIEDEITDEEFWNYVQALGGQSSEIPKVIPPKYAVSFYRKFYSFTDTLQHVSLSKAERTFMVAGGLSRYNYFKGLRSEDLPRVLLQDEALIDFKKFIDTLRQYALREKTKHVVREQDKYTSLKFAEDLSFNKYDKTRGQQGVATEIDTGAYNSLDMQESFHTDYFSLDLAHDEKEREALDWTGRENLQLGFSSLKLNWSPVSRYVWLTMWAVPSNHWSNTPINNTGKQQSWTVVTYAEDYESAKTAAKNALKDHIMDLIGLDKTQDSNRYLLPPAYLWHVASEKLEFLTKYFTKSEIDDLKNKGYVIVDKKEFDIQIGNYLDSLH